MGISDFWLQSNNGKNISLGNLKELKKSDLNGNTALLRLFNIFDTQTADGTKGSDGVLNKQELNSLFDTMAKVAASKGNSSIFETEEAEDFLGSTQTAEGKTLKELGVKVSDMFEFLTKLVKNQNTPITVDNMPTNVNLTEEQAKEEVLSILSNDAAEARTLLMTQDNGKVSDLYNKYKEWKDDDLALSNIEEAIMLQEEGAENLYKAKEGKLSKREYFLQNREHLKMMMKRRLFRKDENTGLDFLDRNRGKMSKDEFAKLMEDFINQEIDKIDRLDSLQQLKHTLLVTTDARTEQMLKNFQKKAENNTIHDPINERNLNEIEKPLVPLEFDTTEPITFEEVFKYERNTEYSKEKVENYLKQKQKTDYALSAYNKYQTFQAGGDDLLANYKKSIQLHSDMDGNSVGGKGLNPSEHASNIVKLFSSYFANIFNPDLAKEELQKLISDNKLPLSINTNEKGEISLDLSQITDDAEKNRVLNKLITLEQAKLKGQLETVLGGDIEEKMQAISQDTQTAYNSAYGTEFSNELVQLMSDDNKTFIPYYTGNTSMLGMGATVVGVILCFTPAAPLGVGMVTIGNTLAIGGMAAESVLGYTEAYTRSHRDDEELKELSKTLIMNAGGFVIGMKAGQAGMKAFNKLIDKKLVEVFKTEMVKGNRAAALKQVFTNPEYLKNFMQAAGVKLSADFLISYAGDLTMMGILDTNDDWMSLLQSNLIGIMAGISGDIKDVGNLGIKGDRYRKLRQKEAEGGVNGKKLTAKEAEELAKLRNDPDIKRAYPDDETTSQTVKQNDNNVNTKKVTIKTDNNSSKAKSILENIQTKEKLLNILEGKINDQKLLDELKNLSDKDFSIIKKTIEDIYADWLSTDQNINSIVETLDIIKKHAEIKNRSFSEELNLINKILSEHTTEDISLLIDCVSMTRIPNSIEELDIVETLLKLKETCDNPLLNIDNIIGLAYDFKDISDINILVERLKAKNPDGTYKYNTNDYGRYNVEPQLKSKDLEAKKQKLIDDYKDYPETHNKLKNILQNADEDMINLVENTEIECRCKDMNNSKEKIAKLLLSKLNECAPDYLKREINYMLENIENDEFKTLINNAISEADNLTIGKKVIKLRNIQKLVEMYNHLQGKSTSIDSVYWKDYLNKLAEDEPELAAKLRGKEIKDTEVKETNAQEHSSTESKGISLQGKALEKFKQFIQKIKQGYSKALVFLGLKLPDFDALLNEKMKEDNLKRMQEYYDYLRAELSESQKVEQFVQYCKDNKDEISDYLYSEVYLNSRVLAPEVKSKCLEISESYGVKVFLEADIDNFEATGLLNMLDAELNQWQKCSNGQAKMPPTLDLTITKADYIDNTSAYGKSRSAGFCESLFDGAISINGQRLASRTTIRHELTHTNDLKRLLDFPEGFVVKNNGEIDAEKCKFYDEFVKIGIPEYHIAYAYNNPKEFIAVASEGDLSKASPEFKKQLIEFGMPEYVFDMEPPNSLDTKLSAEMDKPDGVKQFKLASKDDNINISTRINETLSSLNEKIKASHFYSDDYKYLLDNIIYNQKLPKEEQLKRLIAFDSILNKASTNTINESDLIDTIKATKEDELTNTLIKLDSIIPDTYHNFQYTLLKDSLCKNSDGKLNQDMVAIFDYLYHLTTDSDKISSIMNFISANKFEKSDIKLEGNLLIVKDVESQITKEKIVLTKEATNTKIKAYDTDNNFELVDLHQRQTVIHGYKRKILFKANSSMIDENFANNIKTHLTVMAGFNEQTIKSQRIEYFNDDGTLNYTEVWEPSHNKKGEFEIYQEFPNGKRFLISTAELTNNGEYLSIEKVLDSSEGTKTGYVSVISTHNKDGYYNSLRNCRITDNTGNVLLKRQQKFTYQDGNHYTTLTNDKRFDVTFNDKTFTVKDNNGKVYEINLEEIVEGGVIAQKYYLPILKQLPAEDLIFIKKSGIKLKHSIIAIQHAHASDNTIVMGSTFKYEDRLFVFLHELNHLKDRLLMQTGNLHEDLTLKKIYQEELQLLKKNTSKANEYLLDYFINGDKDDSDPARPLMEVIAEAGAISNSDLVSTLGSRSQTLQQHFPKTIAYITNMIYEKQMQLIES